MDKLEVVKLEKHGLDRSTVMLQRRAAELRKKVQKEESAVEDARWRENVAEARVAKQLAKRAEIGSLKVKVTEELVEAEKEEERRRRQGFEKRRCGHLQPPRTLRVPGC